MRTTQTQLEQVIEHLQSEGFVSNFWALEYRILRLAALIQHLKWEGYHFETKYGDDLGLGGMNFYYYVLDP